ncbi:hypothetical protein [Bradyrhizobium sp. CIR3A]|uniref:hypothetical protein n=1 Tax=Bradyrhizobium sp. CIR3A TaxID=2663838 RepID=UPI001605AB85|nr:hypothetical protein [Bradyrhizobium sp. CIR3A]
MRATTIGRTADGNATESSIHYLKRAGRDRQLMQLIHRGISSAVAVLGAAGSVFVLPPFGSLSTMKTPDLAFAMQTLAAP